jgi:hypothetical protein
LALYPVTPPQSQTPSAMAQRISLPPPYAYNCHQKSLSETNLASPRAEVRAPRPPASERLAPQHLSAVDYYSQGPRRTVYSHNNAIGIEITVLSDATRQQVPVPSWWSDTSDDRFHPRLLNPSIMSRHLEQHQEIHTFYQNSSGEIANQSSSQDSYKRCAPPSVPPPAARIAGGVENERKGSVASGSSAYTGYHDEDSSASSQGHALPLPPPPSPPIPNSKEQPPTQRLFVQNGTSPQGDVDTPTTTAEKSQASVSTDRRRPPPIMTRNANGSPRQIPGSPRAHHSQPQYPNPAPQPQSANYSPVAAYMTTPHGAAFPVTSSPTAQNAYPSPKTASAGAAGFGLAPTATAVGLGSPRLNSSFPEYRQNQRSGTFGYTDEKGNARPTGRGTVNYGRGQREAAYGPSRPSMEVPNPTMMPSISPPARRQTRIKPVPTHACLTLSVHAFV